MPAERRADLWFALALTALAIVVVVESWRMPRLGHLGVHPMSAPGLTPGLIGLVLACLGLALLVRSLRERAAARRAAERAAAEGGSAIAAGPASASSSTWPRALLALALCLGYAPGMLGRLPFMWATGLFVFAFVAAFSFERARPARTLAGAALMAVAVAVGVNLLFQELFLVRLP